MNIIFKPKQIKFFSVILAILISILFEKSLGNNLNTMIKGFCLDEFKREMQSKGKEIDNTLGEFTCTCFINRINIGEDIELARQACKDEVTRNFNL